MAALRPETTPFPRQRTPRVRRAWRAAALGLLVAVADVWFGLLQAPRSAHHGGGASGSAWWWQPRTAHADGRTAYIGRSHHPTYFLDAETAWLVAFDGRMFRTLDGGTHWEAVSEFSQNTVTALHFVDALRGWAVGQTGRILRTEDGGATWSAQDSGGLWCLHAVYFRDAETGWAAGDYGVILHTEDGGATWSVQRVRGNLMGQSLNRIQFTGDQVGWISGNQLLLRTRDGGASWAANVVGPIWRNYRTETVESEPSTFRSPLKFDSGLQFIDAKHGWLCAEEGLFRTEDGGNSWRHWIDSRWKHLSSFEFTDPLVGWAIHYDDTLLRTEDGGRHWSPHADASVGRHCAQIRFFDHLTGWLLRKDGQLLRTTDGGANWVGMTRGPADSIRPETALFTVTRHGWAIDGVGRLRHTTGGGAEWEVQFAPPGVALTDVHFIDARRGWVVGEGGTIHHTEDGGRTWVPQSSGTTDRLAYVRFADGETGWAVGETGAILKTTDGGWSWRPQTSPLTGHVSVRGLTVDGRAVARIVYQNLGWWPGMCGSSLFHHWLLTTLDGGETWVESSAGSSLYSPRTLDPTVHYDYLTDTVSPRVEDSGEGRE